MPPVEGINGAHLDHENIVQNQSLTVEPSRGRVRVRFPSILGPHDDVLPELPRIELPQAANDDCEGLVAVKRKNTRRKRWEADLRTNTTTKSICWDDYWEGRKAWRWSWELGLGLDCMVTIRPRIFQTLNEVERYERTQRWMRQMREFYRDNDNDLPPYAYVLSREATASDGTGEHIHWLVPTAGRQDLVETYLKRKFPEKREVIIEVAYRGSNRLKDGKIGDAATYLLKAACKSARDSRPNTPFRLSGPVYGPRVFWSQNLNPTRPRYRVPAPKRQKGRAEQPFEHSQAVAAA